MSVAMVADTGGLLRALASKPGGEPAWPEFADTLRRANAVIVPSLVLAEVDHFLRAERDAMRRLIAEIFDPTTTYEYEVAQPNDVVRAMQLDAKFRESRIGLVDGIVAAIAERRKVYRVLTIDHADFRAIRVGAKYRRPLTLLP